MNSWHVQQIINEEGGNFKSREFMPDGSIVLLKEEIIRQVVRWRNWHGFKFQPTSGYRTTGSHALGLSVDGLIWEEWRKTQPEPEAIWRLLTTWPFLGVGIYFDWDDGIGCHMDLIWPPARVRPLRWLRVDDLYHYQHPVSGKFIHTNKGDGKISSVLTLESAIEQYRSV